VIISYVDLNIFFNTGILKKHSLILTTTLEAMVNAMGSTNYFKVQQIAANQIEMKGAESGIAMHNN